MKRMRPSVTKRFFSAVLSAAVTTAAFVNMMPVVMAAQATTTDKLNIRSGPGTSYEIVKTIDKGTAVETLDSGSSGWYKIKLADGTQGYCSSQYLQVLSSGSSSSSGSSASANTSGSSSTYGTLTLDTRSYTMAPGNIYDFRAKVEGMGLTQADVNVYSSRTGIATVTRVAGTDKYRVTAKGEGVCYVVAEVAGVHASIKITVQKGVKAWGESTRSISLLGDHPDRPSGGDTPSGGQTSAITLDTKSYQFASVGKVYQFLAKGIASGSSPTVTSSNPSVVSVSLKNANDPRGYLYEIKAVSAGSAVITVSSGSASAQLTATVPGSGGSGGQTGAITLDTKSYQFASVGKVYQFLAKGIASGSSPTVTSSNPSAVSVSLKSANDPRGYLYEIKAVSAGSAVITVSSGSASAQLTATVPGSGGSGGQTSAFTLDTSSYAFSSVGSVYQFLAKGIASGSSPTATSSDSSVVSVSLKNANDSRGYLYEIKAVSAGSAVITVTSGSFTAFLTATVSDFGGSGGGSTEITGARTTTDVNLRSEPNTNCSVLVTLSPGVVVTVLDTTSYPDWTKVRTADGKVGYLYNDYIEYLYGNDGTQVSGLTLSHTSGTIPKGKSYYVKASVSPTGTAVTWTSSNTNVATVSNGFIYGNQPGSAVITAKAGSKTATCNVTVTAADPVKTAYTTPNVAGIGQQVELVAVTDNTRSSVRFVVSMNDGTTKTLDVGNYTTENSTNGNLAPNYTRVWKTAVTFSSPGTYQVAVYSSTGGSSYSSTGATTSSFVVSTQEKTSSTRENRRVSDEMLALIGKWEGYSAAVYPDTLANNIPTIGYGQTFGAGALFYNNQTKTEAWAQLLNSVNGSYTQAVNTFLANNNIKANQQNFDAMVSFSYNVGAGYWSGSSAFDIREIMLNSVVPPTIPAGGLSASATLNFDLFPSASSGGGRLTEVAASTSLQVLQTTVDASTKSVWYQVQTPDGTVGWARSGAIRFSNAASMQRDLSYTDAYAMATEWLRWNQAGGKVYAGLVYRRLGETKVFSFGNYTEADSANANYKKNTYGYTYPVSAQPYEQ